MSLNDDLFDHIRKELNDHEEPYVLGSWERFEKHREQANRKRKRMLFFRAAAAVLIAGLISVYLWIAFSSSAAVEQISGQQQPAIGEPGAPAIEATPQELFSGAAPESRRTDSSGAESPVAASRPVEESSSPAEDAEFIERSAEPASSAPDPGAQPPSGRETPFYDSSKFYALYPIQPVHLMDTYLYPGADESIENTFTDAKPASVTQSSRTDQIVQSSSLVTKEDLQSPGRKSDRDAVTFSVAYASMMNIHDSETDLGSGAGMYADWNFAPRFTLSTGLAISQNNLSYRDRQEQFLAAAELPEVKVSAVEDPVVMSGDQLSSVQLNFLNLEIPFDLRYHISDRFSISAGFSSVTFLREEYDYTFEWAHRPQTFGSSMNESEIPESVVTYRTSHKESEPALSEINWGAFYTFSAGYQHKIFNDYTLSFEPFFRIPAGRVSSRGIRYSTGGLQLRVLL